MVTPRLLGRLAGKESRVEILVTGAAGFIGAALAEALCARGNRVIGIDNLNDYYPVSLKRDRLERVAKCA